MLIGVGRLDSLLCVHGRRGRNHNSLQPLMLQHIVVVLVNLDAVRGQVLLGPFNLSVVGSAGGDQLCARSPFEEVPGMPLAHAAETSTADFQLGDGHDGGEVCMRSGVERNRQWREKRIKACRTRHSDPAT